MRYMRTCAERAADALAVCVTPPSSSAQRPVQRGSANWAVSAPHAPSINSLASPASPRRFRLAVMTPPAAEKRRSPSAARMDKFGKSGDFVGHHFVGHLRVLRPISVLPQSFHTSPCLAVINVGLVMIMAHKLFIELFSSPASLEFLLTAPSFPLRGENPSSQITFARTEFLTGGGVQRCVSSHVGVSSSAVRKARCHSPFIRAPA